MGLIRLDGEKRLVGTVISRMTYMRPAWVSLVKTRRKVALSIGG